VVDGALEDVHVYYTSEMTSPEGYIYCLSNPAHPDIFKIGKTADPEERRKTLSADTGVVFPFKIEFAKKVKDPSCRESLIHSYLHNKRVNPKREFFMEPLYQIKKLFDLVDGEYWNENVLETPQNKTRGRRDMAKCFKDGQRIRNSYMGDYWTGQYNSSLGAIVYAGEEYKSPSAFVKGHIKKVSPPGHRNTFEANGWTQCECECADGSWISIASLKVCN
jgi:hypothetical protein